MCSQQKNPNIPSAYLNAHSRQKTCLKGWNISNRDAVFGAMVKSETWKHGPTLITLYLREVFQEHLLKGSLIGVWRHQLLPWKCFIQVLTGDWGLPDQLALAGLQSRNQPRGLLLKVPVRFVFQIDVDYFMAKRAEETQTSSVLLQSTPCHGEMQWPQQLSTWGAQPSSPCTPLFSLKLFAELILWHRNAATLCWRKHALACNESFADCMHVFYQFNKHTTTRLKAKIRTQHIDHI